MKFLHTSDWHLGRALHGLDLHDAQRDAVSQIARIAADHKVDAVIIAGDIFDRAVPPVESVALFTAALERLSALATVIVTSGNHDSAVRLGYGSPLFRDGVHVITDLSQVGRCIPITAGGVTVDFYPLPYLEPDSARHALKTGDEPLARSHDAVMRAAIERVAADRTARGSSAPAVLIGHAFAVGGFPADSERDIRVGGVDSCAAGLFADFTYAALGHLHGPQQISAGAGDAVIRYSGSPLRYSFSEAAHVKSVAVAEVDAAGACSVELVPIAQPREMATLTGPLSDVLSPAAVSAHSQSWVRAVITDPARPAQLHERLRAAFPYVLSIVHLPGGSQDWSPAVRPAAAVDPVDVCSAFIEDVTNAATTAQERDVLLRAYEAVLRDDAVIGRVSG